MTYDKDSFLAGLSVGLSLRYSKRILGKPICLIFSSPSAFTLATFNTTKNWDGTIEYSTNAVVWSVWSGATTLQAASAGAEYRLYLRGSGNTVITGGYQRGFALSGSDISCSGDIRTLLDYNDPENTQMGSSCFYGLFRDCMGLISAPNLPALKMSNACYASMFFGCSSLSVAPELPAMELAYDCYSLMFMNCTSLIVPPRLPATTLFNNCYSQMFQGCTNLEYLLALPSLTLQRFCYLNMFSGCSKIKLSTTQSNEYNIVFRIPISGIATDIGFSHGNMFSNTGGTFVGTPEINTTYYTSNTIIS